MSKDTDYKRLWRTAKKENVKQHNVNFALITIIQAVMNFIKDKMKKEDYEKVVHLVEGN